MHIQCIPSELYSYHSDDGWDAKDAQVACRMLGLNTSSSVARTHSSFGSGI